MPVLGTSLLLYHAQGVAARCLLLCCCFGKLFFAQFCFPAYLVLLTGSITLTLELTFSISLGFT